MSDFSSGMNHTPFTFGTPAGSSMRTESSLNHREESHPRKKHKHPKVGFKTTESKAYLNQEEILGGKGVIYTTPASNGKYQFRTWIGSEEKYFRRSRDY